MIKYATTTVKDRISFSVLVEKQCQDNIKFETAQSACYK